jgi:hypothetical protein
MKTITEIAQRLVVLLKQQQFVQAYQELFNENAESIDPIYHDQPTLKSLTQLIEREKTFLSRTDIHSINVSEPLLAGNYFTISLSMIFSIAGQEQKKIEELCVYKVEAGKIISQQFFISAN